MKKSFPLLTVLVVACFAMTGCTHTIALMSQDNTNTGSGVANEIGKTVEIELNGEKYTGTYAYVKDGSIGFVNSFAQSSAYSGSHAAYGSAYGTGNFMTQSAAGNGNVIAKSETGKGLRCQFSYSSMSHSGTGVCQDDKKKLYDLQIN